MAFSLTPEALKQVVYEARCYVKLVHSLEAEAQSYDKLLRSLV